MFFHCYLLVMNKCYAVPKDTTFLKISPKKSPRACLPEFPTTTDFCCLNAFQEEVFDNYFLSILDNSDKVIVAHLRPVQSINAICGILHFKGGPLAVYNSQWACNFDCQDIRPISQIEENRAITQRLRSNLRAIDSERAHNFVRIKNVRETTKFTMICPIATRAEVMHYDNLRVDGPREPRSVGFCYAANTEDNPAKKARKDENLVRQGARVTAYLAPLAQPKTMQRLSYNLIRYADPCVVEEGTMELDRVCTGSQSVFDDLHIGGSSSWMTSDLDSQQ